MSSLFTLQKATRNLQQLGCHKPKDEYEKIKFTVRVLVLPNLVPESGKRDRSGMSCVSSHDGSASPRKLFLPRQRAYTELSAQEPG